MGEIEHLLAKYVALKEIESNRVGELGVRDVLEWLGVEESQPLLLRGPGIYWVMGKTMSGKTNAMAKLFAYLDKMVHFTVKDSGGNISKQLVEEVHYFYKGPWQEDPFDKLEHEYNVQFHGKEPDRADIDRICGDKLPRILVLDDMMEHIVNSPDIVDLLTKDVHHMNLMVFLITQMLHPGGKNAVGLRSQGHGYFFFQFTADHQGLRRRFNSLVPKNQVDSVKRFYDEAVGRPRGYVYIDCHSLQQTKYHIYRNIFPDEGVTEVLPKKRRQTNNTSDVKKARI